ncbi:F0F1 ATP synthase subunit I [Rhodobacteraceae bacterium]|nr:F0F1 ATP synthase subunit I [Paracoccaceae bacterium]
MSQEPDPERLKALESKLAKHRKIDVAKPDRDNFAQGEMAWRMVIELVSGLGIGFGIGYTIDVLAGTLPIFMVVFTLLGLIAGVRVMMRTAAELNTQTEAAKASEEEGK